MFFLVRVCNCRQCYACNNSFSSIIRVNVNLQGKKPFSLNQTIEHLGSTMLFHCFFFTFVLYLSKIINFDYPLYIGICLLLA